MEGSTVPPRAEYVVIPPDGGWGWFVVVVAFSWGMVVDGTVYTFGLFLDEFKNDFKVSSSLLSVASSVQMSLYFLLAPMIAAMINRLGFRCVSMLGGTLAFAGVLASSYMDNIYLFITIFGGLLGVAFSMTYLSNMLIVGFYFSTRRAIATGIAVTGTSVGVSVFPVIFSVLMPDYDWRFKYQCISGVHLFMALMGLVYKSIESSEVMTAEAKTTTLESSSLWEGYDKIMMRNKDYPTNTEALNDQPYVIVGPNDPESSRLSMRSTRTIKIGSMSTVYTMASERPKYLPRKCCGCSCRCKYVLCPCLWHDHRPMYRDDILYRGSSYRFSRSKAIDIEEMKRQIDYHMSVTRTSAAADVPQNADCCNCCPVSVMRVLSSMLDTTLLGSFGFFLLALSGFLSYIGLYVPYVYGIQVSVDSGIDYVDATYVLTTIGISNGVGRIVSGPLTLIPKLSALVLSEITLVIAGAAVIVHPFFTEFRIHITCAAIFGFNIATISSLRTIVVVDLLGLDKLTNAFGLIVLMEGLSSLIALPLNSYLYEITDSFICPWVFSGSTIILSGLILIPIPRLLQTETARRLRKRRIRREKQLAAARALERKGRRKNEQAPKTQPEKGQQPGVSRQRTK